jgi:two-component system response regulator MprA
MLMNPLPCWDTSQIWRVLVVDDEPAIRETLSDLLEDEGFIVTRARDGLEALQLMESRVFDLVVSDVKMPRLDGASMARQLRRQGFPIPIVLMSAVYAGVDLAGISFIPKPFDFDVLLRRIREALASSGASHVGSSMHRLRA